MPILLWVIYPIAIWSAYAGMINYRSDVAGEKGLPND
jgi:hypothetical protein